MKGGIGGIGGGAPQLDPIDAMPGEAVDEIGDALSKMKASIDAIGEASQVYGGAIGQLQGQVINLEQAIGQRDAMLQQYSATIEQRLAAMARQISRNTRYLALELATKSPNLSSPAQLVGAAEKYMEFLDWQPPPVVEPESKMPGETASDEPEQTPETKH